jgi:hypothetical protein
MPVRGPKPSQRRSLSILNRSGTDESNGETFGGSVEGDEAAQLMCQSQTQPPCWCCHGREQPDERVSRPSTVVGDRHHDAI